MADSTTALLSAIEGYSKDNRGKKGSNENTQALLDRVHGSLKGSGGPISPGKAVAQELAAESQNRDQSAEKTNPAGPKGVEEPTPLPFGKGGGEETSAHDKPNDKVGDPRAVGIHSAGFASAEKAENDTRTVQKAPPPAPDKDTSTALSKLKLGKNSEDSEKPQDYPDGSSRSDAANAAWTNARTKAKAVVKAGLK